MVPSLSPTNSDEPTKAPSLTPTPQPTLRPTGAQPSKSPSKDPTPSPSTPPTDEPTLEPTLTPTANPSENPSQSPSVFPTTSKPTKDPTPSPTDNPSQVPSKAPSYPATRPPSAADQPCNYVKLEDHENSAMEAFQGYYTKMDTLRSDFHWFKYIRWDGTEEGEMFADSGRWWVQLYDNPDGFFTTLVDTSSQFPPDGKTWDLFDGQRFFTIRNVGIYCVERQDWIYGSDWTDFPSISPSSDQPTVMPSDAPTLSFPTYAPSIQPSDLPSTSPTVSPTEIPSKDPTETPIVYFWLNFTELIVCQQGLIQVSEVRFGNDNGPVTIETIEAINESGSPPGETSAMLADDDTSTKWLDFGFVCESANGEGKRLKGTLSSIPTWYEVYTANDNPRRDPAKWDIHICSGKFCWCDFGRTVASNYRRYYGLGEFGLESCFTQSPTVSPSEIPTTGSTEVPTIVPSSSPTVPAPSRSPSISPSKFPTPSPTTAPSLAPTKTPSLEPTNIPTKNPTDSPSEFPSSVPSSTPSTTPSISPETSRPTNKPSDNPTTTETLSPTTTKPTGSPTTSPTTNPTLEPTAQPTQEPTTSPSEVPTASDPSLAPSQFPTKAPSKDPTPEPTDAPSVSPTNAPSTSRPTKQPSDSPSKMPTPSPTDRPSQNPTASTAQPSPRPTTDDWFNIDDNFYVWMTAGECMDVDGNRFDQLVSTFPIRQCAEECNKYVTCVGISSGVFDICQLAFKDGTLPQQNFGNWAVSQVGNGDTVEVGAKSSIQTGFLECYRRIRPPTQRPTTSPTSTPTDSPTPIPSISYPTISPSSDSPSVSPSFTTVAPTSIPSIAPVTEFPTKSPSIAPTTPMPTNPPTTIDQVPIQTSNDDFIYVYPGICQDLNGDDFDAIVISNVGNGRQGCADHCAGFQACLGFTWFESSKLCSLMFQDNTWPKEYLLLGWTLSDTGDGETCVIGIFEQTRNAEFFQCYRRDREAICPTEIVTTTTSPPTVSSPSISPSTTTTTTTLKPTSSISDCDDLRENTDLYVDCLKTRISSLENRVDNMETTCRSYCDNLKNEIEVSLIRNTCDQ